MRHLARAFRNIFILVIALILLASAGNNPFTWTVLSFIVVFFILGKVVKSRG